MLIERETIVAILRAGGHHDLALQAACALPRYLDFEKDRALLHRLGAHPDALLEHLEASSHVASRPA